MGFEADDVIGSLATQIKNRSERTWIVSSDKDFQQLLEDGKIDLLKPVFHQAEERWQTMTATDFREQNDGLDPKRYIRPLDSRPVTSQSSDYWEASKHCNVCPRWHM